MANNFSEETAFPRMKRVAQLNDFFCGPAVLRMLLSFWGVKVLQRQIVERMGLSRQRMRVHGMSVPDMARAVELVAPELQFWSKQQSSMADLDRLVNYYKIPVGVEWQGIFGEYADEEDDGHFSIVTGVSMANNSVSLADPFGPFSEEDREFSVKRFSDRWWDENEVTDETGKKYGITDWHLMFVVVPKGEDYLEELGMRPEAMMGEPD